VTYSTDYVFDGTARQPYVESSPTAPINAYGRTKLEGEELALGHHPRSLIVRTSWVISGTHSNFVGTMINLARRQDLTVVDDQVGCPTVADDLAAATLAALDEDATGILHLTNVGETTWYRLARQSLEIAGLDPERIQPCTTDDFPTKAARPVYSALGSERRETAGIPPLPSWQASLPGVVRGQLDRLGIG
jgi:dTDP-4-dehydrorhamnose reductase